MPVVPSGSTVPGLVETAESTVEASGILGTSEIIGTSVWRVDSDIDVFCRPSGLLVTWVPGTSVRRIDSDIDVFGRPSRLLITWVQKPPKRRRSRAISRAGVGT